jgi:hypothetical protein
MLFGNAIEFAQMALRLIPKILYPVDMVSALCKQL